MYLNLYLIILVSRAVISLSGTFHCHIPKKNDYIGNISKTISGFNCLPWVSIPNKRRYVYNDFPMNRDLSWNNCRNLRNPTENLTGPWCYHSYSRYELCDVPVCPEYCPAGQHIDSQSRACKSCPADTYKKNNGTDLCKPCKKFFTTYAKEGSIICDVQCLKGYQLGAKETCTECPMNSFKSNITDLACKECPSGSYTISTGSTACFVEEDGTVGNLMVWLSIIGSIIGVIGFVGPFSIWAWKLKEKQKDSVGKVEEITNVSNLEEMGRNATNECRIGVTAENSKKHSVLFHNINPVFDQAD